MDRTFFPNTYLKHQDQSERDREEKEAQLSEANKPLLENEFEEEVILKFMYFLSFLPQILASV